MASLPQLPAPSSLRDLTTGLRQLTTTLSTLRTDDPRRRQLVQDYQALHQQVAQARPGLGDLTS